KLAERMTSELDRLQGSVTGNLRDLISSSFTGDSDRVNYPRNDQHSGSLSNSGKLGSGGIGGGGGVVSRVGGLGAWLGSGIGSVGINSNSGNSSGSSGISSSRGAGNAAMGHIRASVAAAMVEKLWRRHKEAGDVALRLNMGVRDTARR
ncbi:unnamed protein product, partial [Closterium sp. Naga37s-1]